MIDAISTASLMTRVDKAHQNNMDFQDTVGTLSGDGTGAAHEFRNMLIEEMVLRRSTGGVRTTEAARRAAEQELEPVMNALGRAQRASIEMHYATAALNSALDRLQSIEARRLGYKLFA